MKVSCPDLMELAERMGRGGNLLKDLERRFNLEAAVIRVERGVSRREAEQAASKKPRRAEFPEWNS